MSVVYKYLKIFDEDFFKDPTIKISVPKHLNDPFESEISDIIDEKINSILEYRYMLKGEDRIAYYKISKSYITTKMLSNGVISLTENNSEILMWSHYADNHKGMCIGLEDDFMTHKKSDDMLMYYQDMLSPMSVIYTNDRLNLKKDIDIKYFQDNLYQALILNKYKKWEYEQEKRIIMPLHFADRFLIDSDRSILERLPCNEFLKKIEMNGKTHYENNCTQDKDTFDVFAQELGKHEKATFLIKIPRGKIKTIHFGCKTPKSTIEKILTQIKDPKNKLEHVRVFRFSLSENKFELTEAEIS